MNAGRDVERLIASWLVEEAPGRAPDRILDGAGRVIDRTNQRRFVAAWRDPMYVTMRGLAAAAVIGAVLIGGAIFVLNGAPRSDVGASPSPSPEPTAMAAPIPPGTYVAEVAVAGILADLDDEPDLSEDDRQSIIDDILSIRGATTLDLELVITADRLTVRQGTDGGPKGTNPPWQLFTIDEDTIAVRGLEEGAQLLGYDVIWAEGSFTLKAVSPPPGRIQAFTRHTLFEVSPYSPKP